MVYQIGFSLLLEYYDWTRTLQYINTMPNSQTASMLTEPGMLSAQFALKHSHSPSNIIAAPTPEAAGCLLLHGISPHVLLVQLRLQLHHPFGQDVLQRLRLLGLGAQGMTGLETPLGMQKDTWRKIKHDVLIHGGYCQNHATI